MEKTKTAAQILAQQLMDKKSGTSINWDELKFKIENGKDYYFRFVPDADPENELFFLDFKTFKLNDTTYVNYPIGHNIVQKTLNSLWATGDSTAKAVYSNLKGKESHNVAIVLCDSNGRPESNKAKIWSIGSKKLWDSIMSLFFTDDFINGATTYFKVSRTGEKVETVYRLEQFEGDKIDYSKIELIRLDLPLAFKKSDQKALPILQKLNKQFSLGVELAAVAATTTTDDDGMDEFEKKLLKEIDDN